MSNASIAIETSEQFKEHDVCVEISSYANVVTVGTKDYITDYEIKLKPARKGSKRMVPFLCHPLSQRADR